MFHLSYKPPLMPLALRLHTPTRGMRTTYSRSSRFLISSPLLYCFSYYCALQFCCKVLGVVAGLEPATNGVNDISSLYALPTELHDTPYIFPHTSSWQPHQPTATTAEPIRTIGLAIRILYSFRSVCCRSTATIFSLQFSQPSLGLVLLPASLIVHIEANSWLLLVRKLPASDCCTRDPLSCRLFPLVLQPGLFRCRFNSELCTIPCGITRHPSCRCVYSVYSAYLPGLHAARPSAFVEGYGVEPSAHPRLFDVTAEG